MTEQNSDHSLPSLPDGILLDILSRLPTKSLHRFKSVSTTFRRLISGDPHFLRLHALRSAANPRRRVAVLTSHAPPSSVALRSVSASTISADTLSVAPLSGDFKYSYPSARVWNSCDGLVLISISEKTFFVWNPSTREKEQVRFIPSRRWNWNSCLLGLGFDKVEGEFKVVAAYQRDGRGDRCYVLCSSLQIDLGSWDTIFTEEQTREKEQPNRGADGPITTVGKHSGSRDTIFTEEQTGEKEQPDRNADGPSSVGKHAGSWGTIFIEERTGEKEGKKEQRNRTDGSSGRRPRVRKIRDFPYRVCGNTPGCEVGGDLYWMVVRKTGDPAIIGFDFGEKVFVETTQPSWVPGVSKYGLGVLGGSLCVVCHGKDNVEVLGLKESWEKLFVVPYDAGCVQFKTLAPLCFTGNGEVVMEVDRRRLVVYNVEERKCRLLSCLSHDNREEWWERTRSGQLRVNGSGFKVVVYVESLVSPSGSSKSIKNLCSKVQQQLRLG